MVGQLWWNSTGGTVLVEQLWWNRNVEQYRLNSSGGTVMVEQ